MATLANTNADTPNLDKAWESQSLSATKTPSPTPSPSSERTYTLYAAATISDQEVSGMTDSEPVQDTHHEELTNKSASLETMLVQLLCQQVQTLTNTAKHKQQLSNDLERSLLPRKKQLDCMDSCRKHKQTQHNSASSRVADDRNKPAPIDEDCLTVWDNYLPKHDDDL